MTEISMMLTYQRLADGRRNFDTSWDSEEIEELEWLGVVDFELHWKANSCCYEILVTTFRPNPALNFSPYRHLNYFSYHSDAVNYSRAKEIVREHCRMLMRPLPEEVKL